MDWFPIKSLVRRYEQRSARLIASFDEVHWEIWDSTLRRRHSITKIDRTIKYASEARARWTFDRARRVKVKEDEFTKEFCDARSNFWVNGPYTPEHKESKGWCNYKIYCNWRNTWAPYFRSNLDWDWDVAGSLRRLYKIENPFLPANRHSPSTNIAVDGTSWNISSKDSWKELPADVRIAYKIETGEIQYMMFSRDIKSSKVATDVRDSVSDHDDNPEEQVLVDYTKMGFQDRSDASTDEIDAADGDDVATTALETTSVSGSSLIVQECNSGSWLAQYIDGLPAPSSAVEALENEDFIEELAGEAEGETRIFEMSAELLQVRS